MNPEHRHFLKNALAIGLLCAWSILAQAADGTGKANPLVGAKESLSLESGKLEAILNRQSEEDATARDWEDSRTQDAQLRAMYREAVLLSELSVAWIEDQLDHWDCRVAEQAEVEVQQRQAELSDYSGKLQMLCAQVGPQDTAQQRVCQTQVGQTDEAQQALLGLAQRYQGECTAAEIAAPDVPAQKSEAAR